MSIRFSKRIRNKECKAANEFFSEIKILIDQLCEIEKSTINEKLEIANHLINKYSENYDFIERLHKESNRRNSMIIYNNINRLLNIVRSFCDIEAESGINNPIIDNIIIDKFTKTFVRFIQKTFNMKKSLRSIRYGETECPVCLDEFTNKNINVAKCNHAICSNCILKCSFCPVCRLQY